MLREPGGMDIPKFMELLEEWKGDESWYLVSKRCGLDHSVISRIKGGDYCPGYRTIAKLSQIAPSDYRTKLYNQLLEAAGLCGPYILRRRGQM